MGEHVTAAIVTIVLGILGVATIAVIFSEKAQTGRVINAASGGLATDILAAVSPITGNAPMLNSQY